MTTERIRSLDAVDPPDQWADIVARADAGSTDAPAPAPEGEGHERRWLLAVAAGVLVVAALAAALVLRPGGHEDRADDPAAIWGHEWQLVRIEVSGGEVTEDLTTARNEPVRLDATREGRLITEVCNRFTVDTELEANRLRFDAPGTPAIHCPDGLEDLVANLFSSSASVQVRGSELVLRTPQAVRRRIVDQVVDPVLPPRTTYTFVRADAAASVEPTDGAPSEFFGHRWALVEALDDGVRLAQPGDYAIEAGADGTFVAPGCDHVHGPASLDGDHTLTVEVAAPGPLADCYFGEQTNWDDWFRELLAARPEVAVDGQRALIVARGKQVLLVRLD